MPIIKKEDINEEYFGKYILTVIMPDGKIIAIERNKADFYHRQSFVRLIKEIKKITKIEIAINKEKNAFDFLNLLSGNGMIAISTFNLAIQQMGLDMQMIKFPKNMKKRAISSMQQLLIAFKKIGYIEFNEYGIDDKQAKNGLDNLIEYINGKIKEIDAR